MLLSCGSDLGRALILKEGDVFSNVPEPHHTYFQQKKNTMKIFRNDFGKSFLQNLTSRLAHSLNLHFIDF